MCEISLANSTDVTYVSSEDFDMVNNYIWKIFTCSNYSRYVYATTESRRRVRLHEFISMMQRFDNITIDNCYLTVLQRRLIVIVRHADGDALNNRRSNLQNTHRR